MADEIDLATEQTERWLKQALANNAKSSARLAPLGKCYFCEREFTSDEKDFDKKLFCDSDCQSDYEREQRILNRK